MRERVVPLTEVEELLGKLISERLGFKAHTVKPVVDDQTGQLISLKVEETIPIDIPTTDEMALMLSVDPLAGVKMMRRRTDCRLMDAASWKFFIQAICGDKEGDWKSLRDHIDSRLAGMASIERNK